MRNTNGVEVLMPQLGTGRQCDESGGWVRSPVWSLVSRKDLRGIRKLELAFDSRALRTVCESEAEARRELGTAMADILKRRLADLRAATSVRDLVAGNPRVGPDGQIMLLDLADGYRLVIKANHINNPLTGTAGLDWEQVTRVKIIRIEGENDER